MICSINFLIKIFLFQLLLILLLTGCAEVNLQSANTELKDSGPQILSVTAEMPPPQMLGAGPIIWSVVTAGGVGEHNIRFELERNGGWSKNVQSGPASTWSWLPERAGNYRMRTIIKDSLGNQVEGDWSEPYLIAPLLVVKKLQADKRSPQAAMTGAIAWSVTVEGGIGETNHGFELKKDGRRLPIISAKKPGSWSWAPEEPGSYRIRAVVTDSLGNQIEGDWSEPYVIAPALTIEKLSTDKQAPQAAATVPILWTVAATGGVGERIISFEFEQDGKKQIKVQTGVETNWSWRPDQADDYRVRIIIEDSLGNKVEGDWSEWYEIAPPLMVESLTTDKTCPQAAMTGPIEWTAAATGGVGALNYGLELERDGQILPVIATKTSGPWAWRPQEQGSYRIRVVVTDSLGNSTEDDWSEPYVIAPPLLVESLSADKTFPQAALGGAIAWTTMAGGGVGELNQSFELEKDGKRLPIIAAGLLGSWSWAPEEPGSYRIRAVVTDSLGNRVEGDWSDPYVIAPPLQIESLAFDRSNPQAAQSVPITWTAEASGGVGARTYLFQLSRNEEIEQFVQKGPDTNWSWIPENEGQYKIRMVATDSLGNQVESEWSDEYEIVPPLKVATPKPDNLSNQYLIHSRITWSTQSSGGVGKKKYAFILEQRDGESITTPIDSDESWTWRPESTGFYRVRVAVIDARGNQQESEWSDWKESKNPLSFGSLKVSDPSPQQASRETIHWSAATAGGVGIVTYEFRSLMHGIESIEQRSSSPEWGWQPRKAGLYKVKIRTWDAENHVVESEWSDEYLITPAISTDTVIAFLPIVNLADTKAPTEKIGDRFASLIKFDLQLLPTEDLERFMQEHRMRYTGGVNRTLAKALRDETGTGAVFITALETWQEGPSPRVSLISRLVTTGNNPEIVWIDSVGLTGEDSPGLLGLGRITSSDQLLNMALGRLVSSLRAYLAGNDASYRQVADRQGVRLINGKTEPAEGSLGTIKGRHQPQFAYRASAFDPTDHYRVAVIPFLNINARKYAEQIVALHLVKQLNRYANIRVFEPGLVRQALLRYRMIMQAGPSMAASDILVSKDVLGADLIVSGRVFDYQGSVGRSKVDFSVLAFNGSKREVIWASRSYATGDEGVYLFDWGVVPSAHGLISKMTQAVIQQLAE